jgi:hypothetical protein
VQNKFEASIVAWFKVFVHNALLQWFFQHLISKNNPQNHCPLSAPWIHYTFESRPLDGAVDEWFMLAVM